MNRWTISLLASLAWVAACSGDDDHDHDDTDVSTDDTDMSMDDTDMSMDDTDLPTPHVYADGLTKTGDGGNFSFELTLSNGMMVGETDVTLTLTSLIMAGMPVAGGTVDLEATMPAMGHGTNDITFTESPDGTYTATGLDITMGGLWVFDVTAAGPAHSDTVQFAFEYAGGM